MERGGQGSLCVREMCVDASVVDLQLVCRSGRKVSPPEVLLFPMRCRGSLLGRGGLQPPGSSLLARELRLGPIRRT